MGIFTRVKARLRGVVAVSARRVARPGQGMGSRPRQATSEAVRLAVEALSVRRRRGGKAQRTKQGFLASKVQPGIRNCIATASSRAPSPCA